MEFRRNERGDSQIVRRCVGNLLIIDSGLNEGWSTLIIPKFEQDDPLRVSSDEMVWIVNFLYVGVGLTRWCRFF